MLEFLRHIWADFKEFIWTQILVALLLTVIATYVQFRKGLPANLGEVLLPYGTVIGGFVVWNVGRTIFLRERQAIRKKRHDEHRTERKAYLDSLKPPVPPPPKLHYGRHYFSTVDFGSEVMSHSRDCLLVEISNEHGDSVGDAKRIRGQITYLDKNGKVLHRKCPVRWERAYDGEINIRKGEGESLVMAVCEGPWVSNLYDGIELKQCSRIEVRLLDAAGNEVTEMMPFAFGFKRDWDTTPFCTKL